VLRVSDSSGASADRTAAALAIAFGDDWTPVGDDAAERVRTLVEELLAAAFWLVLGDDGEAELLVPPGAVPLGA
jgi:hypothetical protein